MNLSDIFNNAKETLSKSSVEDNRYTDIKHVKSSCGFAYLGVLKVGEDYLKKKDLEKRNSLI